MKRLKTMISYDDLFSLAKRGGKAQGTPAFIELFKPALLELDDDTLDMLIRGANFWICMHLFSRIEKVEAIHILIIQEYVKRVEKSEEEERKAQERLEELKKEVRKEDWYRQIVEKEDSSILYNLDLESVVDKKMRANEALEKKDSDAYLDWAIWEAALQQFIINQERRRQAPEQRFNWTDLYEQPRMSGKHFEYFKQDDLINDSNFSNSFGSQFIQSTDGDITLEKLLKSVELLTGIKPLKEKEKKK